MRDEKKILHKIQNGENKMSDYIVRATAADNQIREMIAEGKPIEVNCHFCNTNYVFSVEDLKEILKKSK